MKKLYKCPFCTFQYEFKKSLYDHMEKKHKEQLNNKSAAQIYFNYKNKKTTGHCIMCKKETKWNPETERYERLCSEQCKKKYRELFRKRMIKRYGTDNLLTSEEQQKKMLANRKISGQYKWKDGGITPYVGSYELDFLEFLDNMLGLKSTDVMGPAPQIFEYTYEGKKRFHIPDFYIPSMNLIIQVKASTNKHYRLRDIKKELLIDRLIQESPYNYIKVMDKKYTEFENYFKNFDFVEKK